MQLRPLGRADVEFYESGAVLSVAYALSNTDADGFDKLSYRRRQHWLDRAVTAVQALVNSTRFITERAPILARRGVIAE